MWALLYSQARRMRVHRPPDQCPQGSASWTLSRTPVAWTLVVESCAGPPRPLPKSDTREVDRRLVGRQAEQPVQLGIEEPADGHRAEIHSAGREIDALSKMPRIQPNVAISAK